MTTVGGGVGLVILLIIGALFSERRWLRVLCVAYLAVYVTSTVVLILMEELEPFRLFPMGLFVVAGLLFYNLKRSFDRWKY